jgi:hypothetical protein
MAATLTDTGEPLGEDFVDRVDERLALLEAGLPL